MEQDSQQDSQIVVGLDGYVLASTGDIPDLVGARLEDCGNVAPGVRDAGKVLLRRLSHSRSHVLTQYVQAGPRRTHLIAVEAVGIHRSATELRALFASKLGVLSSQAAAAHLTLRIAFEDAVPAVVYLDAEKIAWAVSTLVGNALRYVQSGARGATPGRVTVHVDFNAVRSQLTITVQDNGPGVSADTVARLFQRDGLNVRGSGLALLLMSDVCAAHGGTIDVQSSTDPADHGTVVRLVLPCDR